MRYNKIRKMDISNGKGIRVSIFVQGCAFNCKGCFNPDTHDFNSGKPFSEKELNILLDLCNSPRIKGLSVLGGEPLHDKNIEGVIEIVKNFKSKYPNKDVWIWSGYLIEDLLKEDLGKEVLNYCDVLIDGQFIEELRDLNLKFRGSSNQRVIDVKETISKGNIILLEE